MTKASPTPEDLDASLFEHVGLHLWQAAKAWETQLYRRAAQCGFENVRQTDSEILSLLPPTGLSISELARRRGVSKQAMQQALGALSRRGILRVEDDPDDRRMKRVVYTPHGLELVAALRDIKRALEEEATKVLGKTDARAFADGLNRLTSAWAPENQPR